MDKRIGGYAFIIGVIIAIVLGLAADSLGAQTAILLSSILVVLGLVVGFINVAGKETKDYLITAAILVFVAGQATTGLSSVSYLGRYLAGIFMQLVAFVVPAVIVVALKEILALSQKS